MVSNLIELLKGLMDVKESFSLKLDFVRQGSAKEPMKAAAGLPRLEDLLANQSDIFAMTERVTNKDVLMYIYTSGTTGLPKPAIIKHGRYIAGGFTFYEAAGFNDKDVFLVTLPVYHSNAGVLGMGCTMICGGTVVLCKKFSASNFFKVRTFLLIIAKPAALNSGFAEPFGKFLTTFVKIFSSLI
jgi:acyl-CoA synthetase (AMP-forming)/AMP-acid ligase II